MVRVDQESIPQQPGSVRPVVALNSAQQLQKADFDVLEADSAPFHLSLSPPRLFSLVRHTFISLHNDFNVLSMEHPTGAISDPTIVIALGADPIGGDD
ncbi:unnamed protein product [Amaranthus hypochondriacus]